MSAAAALDLNRAAYLAGARALYRRSSSENIADIQACARVLAREVESWSATPPSEPALITVETSLEGLRRLLGHLRMSRAG